MQVVWEGASAVNGGCDYCDEELPLWHRREGDELEGDQFVPCQLDVPASEVLSLISEMIVQGFSREQVQLLRQLAKGRVV